MKKKQEWLVTVSGYDGDYAPMFTIITVVITLDEGITPIDWFLGKPTVYSRFGFVPNALLKFWKIKKGTKKD